MPWLRRLQLWFWEQTSHLTSHARTRGMLLAFSKKVHSAGLGGWPATAEGSELIWRRLKASQTRFSKLEKMEERVTAPREENARLDAGIVCKENQAPVICWVLVSTCLVDARCYPWIAVTIPGGAGWGPIWNMAQIWWDFTNGLSCQYGDDDFCFKDGDSKPKSRAVGPGSPLLRISGGPWSYKPGEASASYPAGRQRSYRGGRESMTGDTCGGSQRP